MTLIVLLILAGVSLNGLFGAEGIFNRTREVAVKTEFAMIKEELDIYIADKMIENSEFDVNTLNAYKSSLNYNTKTEEGGNIDKILNRSKYEKLGIFEITNGKLLYTVDDKNLAKWAREMGILTNLYEIDENGVLLSAETNKTLAEGTGGTLTIPDTIKGKLVTSIGEGAFGLAEGVTKIILPRTVTTIEKNAFRGNTTLKEIELPEGLLTIGEYAFADCTSLQSIIVPDTVTDIGMHAFSECTSLANIKLSNSMKTIKTNIMSNAPIEEIEIPDSVEVIAGQAFYANRQLKKIKLSSKVSTIGGLAFPISVEEIDTENNQYYSFTEGVLTNKEGTKIVFIAKSAYMDNGKTLKIPYKIEKLEGTILDTVNKYILPATLKEAPPQSRNVDIIEFYNEFGKVVTQTEYFSNINGQLCSKDGKELYYCYLIHNTEIKLNEGIEIIKSTAFANCRVATSLEIPNSVTTLDRQSIFGLINVKDLSLGKNITNIEAGAFLGSFSFENITIDNDKYMIENGAIYIKNKSGQKETLLQVVLGKNATAFKIPKGIKVIESSAFWGTDFKSIELPEGIIKINDWAFSNCKLDTIEIPSSVIYIGGGAFANCNSLTSVTILEGVTTIGPNAFSNCSNLETIQIPITVNSIGQNAFANCKKLKTVEINRQKDEIIGSPWGLIIGNAGIKWIGTK